MKKLLAIGPAIAIVLAIWLATYSSDGDPKNIKYVLWKHDLYPLDLDKATDTMVGDRYRNTLVIGKTRAELEKKFGYLLSPDRASDYLNSCYQTSSWRGREVMFLRKSPWMVVFSGERASELVLIKGC
jgi:hypothetical protein